MLEILFISCVNYSIINAEPSWSSVLCKFCNVCCYLFSLNKAFCCNCNDNCIQPNPVLTTTVCTATYKLCMGKRCIRHKQLLLLCPLAVGTKRSCMYRVHIKIWPLCILCVTRTKTMVDNVHSLHLKRFIFSTWFFLLMAIKHDLKMLWYN